MTSETQINIAVANYAQIATVQGADISLAAWLQLADFWKSLNDTRMYLLCSARADAFRARIKEISSEQE